MTTMTMNLIKLIVFLLQLSSFILIATSQLRYTDDTYSPTYARNYPAQVPPRSSAQASRAIDNRDWNYQNPMSSSMQMSRNGPQMTGNGASMISDNHQQAFTTTNGQNLIPKITRHITSSNYNNNNGQQARSFTNSSPPSAASLAQANYCQDKLCYGLPQGCVELAAKSDVSPLDYACQVLVTSKRIIDPMQPVKRDILFELYAKTDPTTDSYAAVGFSETGRMHGLVSACIHSDKKSDKLNLISLQHSYNIFNAYTNVPVTIRSGIKNLGVQVEDGTFQCRWIVQSSVEFTFDHFNGSVITTQTDLGYKNFYIQLAQGDYDSTTGSKYNYLVLIFL